MTHHQSMNNSDNAAIVVLERPLKFKPQKQQRRQVYKTPLRELSASNEKQKLKKVDQQIPYDISSVTKSNKTTNNKNSLINISTIPTQESFPSIINLNRKFITQTSNEGLFKSYNNESSSNLSSYINMINPSIRSISGKNSYMRTVDLLKPAVSHRLILQYRIWFFLFLTRF